VIRSDSYQVPGHTLTTSPAAAASIAPWTVAPDTGSAIGIETRTTICSASATSVYSRTSMPDRMARMNQRAAVGRSPRSHAAIVRRNGAVRAAH
jgi:hypothetical protein